MTSDTRQAAGLYLARGWAIVPLAPNAKSAIGVSWQTIVFRAEDVEPGDNLGLKTGPPSGGLVDVDLDAPEAVAVADALLPPTAMIHGRPGKPRSHRWYLCPKAEKTRKWTDDAGASLVELRAAGAQTVVPPSTHPSGEAIAWDGGSPGDPAVADLETLSKAVRLVATAALLARRPPGPGSRPATAVAAGDGEYVDRERAAFETARKALEDPDAPILGAGRLAKLVGEATVRRIKFWWGVDDDKKTEDAIDRLNARHAIVFEASGDVLVVTEDFDPRLDRAFLRYSSFADLAKKYPERVAAGTDRKGETAWRKLGDVWLEHPRRRRYEGLEFAPSNPRKDWLNLWKGFAVEPGPGDWSAMHRHIEDVVCDGDVANARYLLAWLAACVKRPGEPAETAVALRGGQGVGKGMFVREFGRLFGQHFVHLDSSRHLTGHFNAHLRDAVVVFADEAAWPGDKAGEGALKRLVTEPTLAIERKGVDVVSVPNVVHLILASNGDWIVPAGIDDRRFFVLDVSAARANDHGYFGELRRSMREGGASAMLRDLLEWGDEVDLRTPPQTAALMEQKILSMDPQRRWWYAKLQDGRLIDGSEGWPEEVDRRTLHNDYVRALEATGSQRRATSPELGLFLRKILPDGFPGGRRTFLDGHRGRTWSFPSLNDCRRSFDAAVRRQYDPAKWS